MESLKKTANIFDRILDLLASISGCIIVIITLAVCINAMLKYFLNQPITGVEEITEYLLLFITFLGGAWLLRSEGHVNVDFLVVMLNPRTQAVLGFVTSLLGIAIFIVLTWYGSKVTWVNFLRGEHFPTVLEIPKAWVLVFIPLGSLLLLIQFIRRAARNFRRMRFPEESNHSLGEKE